MSEKTDKSAELNEKINQIVEFNKQLCTIGTERNMLNKEIRDKFLFHPQWPMFLERHGVSGFSDDMGGRQFYDFTFYEDGTCEIECRDVFRGELVDDVTTKRFKVSEFVDFLCDEKYYNPLLERFNRLKEYREKKSSEERQKAEYELYQRLRKKYGNAN